MVARMYGQDAIRAPKVKLEHLCKPTQFETIIHCIIDRWVAQGAQAGRNTIIHVLSERSTIILQASPSWPFGTKPIGLTCRDTEIGQGPDMRLAALSA